MDAAQEWMVKTMRLIDADALEIDMVIEEAETPLMPWYPSHMPMRKTLGVSIEQIDNAPTIDATPVVRCKDCRWQEECVITELWGGGNGYCRSGERKDDE